MKALVITAFLILSSLAEAADIKIKEVYLSTCFKYPAFTIKDVRREKYGPESYDLLYYDMSYRKVERILLIMTDPFGKIIEEKEIDRETIQNKRFSVSERYGNEQTVATDVTAYLRANKINVCR